MKKRNKQGSTMGENSLSLYRVSSLPLYSHTSENKLAALEGYAARPSLQSSLMVVFLAT